MGQRKSLTQLAELLNLDASTLRMYVGTVDGTSKRTPKLIGELIGKTWSVDEDVARQWYEAYKALPPRGVRRR